MAEPESGKVLAGKYELIDIAGEGGMATVWRARTRGAAGFARTVAVKRILEGLSDHPEFVAMFVEEARVVANLSHPNVVQIQDFDADDGGNYYLVMEWVEGLTLSAWCVAHESVGWKTPWPLLCGIGIEVLKGLGAAHERRDDEGRPAPVFHRDVTPHNVLLGVNGIVKLTDFGLARAMDRARMTRPEVVKGKLSYLAPELAHGKDPSAASDIFAVGIVLFEALCGRKLFDAEAPAEVIMQVREAHVPDISVLRPDVPKPVVQVVERALKKDPADRFETTRTMATALAQVLRKWPGPTGSDEIGRSVVEAQGRLRESHRPPPDPSPDLDPSEVIEVPPVAAPPPPPPPSGKKR